MASPLVQAILSCSLILAGSFVTVSDKLQFQTCAPGFDYCEGDSENCDVTEHENNHTFSKPWLQTTLMCTGEFACLFVYLISRIWICDEGDEGKTVKQKAKELAGYWYIYIILSLLDLTCTALSEIGLMMIPSSVYQMFRCVSVLFTGVLAKLLFKRQFGWVKVLGMLVSAVGLIVVGISGLVFSSDTDTSVEDYIIGIALVVAGQLSSSVHVTIEEKYLKQADLNPLLLIGMEGGVGTILIIGIGLTTVSSIDGDDCGKYENVLDGLKQLSQNYLLLGLFLGALVAIVFYVSLGLFIMKLLSSVHYMLADSCRTVVVWVVMVVIHYASGSEHYGETWGKNSYIQLAGFFLLVLGTLIFNRVFPLERWLGLPDSSPPSEDNRQINTPKEEDPLLEEKP